MVRRGQSCRLLGWTDPRWSRPQFRGGGCSGQWNTALGKNEEL